MKKHVWAMVLVCAIAVFCGCEKVEEPATPSSTPTVTETATATPSPSPTEVPIDWDSMTLKDRYADNFKIGVALPSNIINHPLIMENVVKKEFNSFTFENEMKPSALLNMQACQSGYPATNTEPTLQFKSIDKGMKWAQDNDFGVRGHTLVWHSQTPDWFFTTDYKYGSPLASREVMLARMESYIRQVMTYCQENYPGVIYVWDVVNEALEPAHGEENGMRVDDSLWYQTIGPDFVYWAFYYANQYVEDGVDLFYNDYNCSQKRAIILKLLKPLVEQGLCDGIGMQCHLNTGNNIANDVYYTARTFAEIGLEVQITELDIQQLSEGENGDSAQAIKYKLIFEKLEKAQEEGLITIDSITVWGLYDEISWVSDRPLLFRMGEAGGLERKPAWYGAMQDPSILAIEW